MSTFKVELINPRTLEMEEAIFNERHRGNIICHTKIMTMEEIIKTYGDQMPESIQETVTEQSIKNMNADKLLELPAIKRIAEEYELTRNQFESIDPDELHLFRKFINHQFQHLSKEVYFDFVDTDPYKYDSVEEMRNDVKAFGYIKINTSGNDSSLWGKVYNLMFRGIHDMIHASYNLNFTYEDEVEAFKQQMKLSKTFSREYYHINWPLYEKILRSEIVYQAAYKTHYKVFHLPEQKIILDDL